MPTKIIAAASAAVVLSFIVTFYLMRASEAGHLVKPESAPSFKAFPAGPLGLSDKVVPDLGPSTQNNGQLEASNQSLKTLLKEEAVTPEASPTSSHSFEPYTGIPEGVEVPWAWIENLDPVKRTAVERAFGDAAAALRVGIPKEAGIDDAKIEASMAKLEEDVAKRLKSILSPQEFEVYLLSLPDDALRRLGYEKSGN